MLANIAKKIFGSRNERILRQLQKNVEQINALESQYALLSDADLRAKTDEFRMRYEEGTTIDQLLPEAFAVVREASKRTLGLRPFDVQLIGGMVLNSGKIAEMRTGEGKTLSATLPAYLNALSGQSVHIVTVNDYLARRDAEWMKPVYTFLGLTVGVVVPNQGGIAKREAYKADIIYGTNNEFGFDYLRDNMAFSLEDRVQGKLFFAVVDEVDSILIDEARTPLIISGVAEESSEMYRRVNTLIPLLQEHKEEAPGDYSLDEKTRQVYLTEDGHQKVEDLLIKEGLLKEGESLYDATNISLMHHVIAGLRAHALFHRDIDYIVKNNQIIIVDEHTGRTLEGRRWSEGLHQAVEAKEGVQIQQENQTLASITFQNYFRLYEKLSGMTGTADTEAYEFSQIYNLEVVVIPTHKPCLRIDVPDQIYLTKDDKLAAVIAEIKTAREKGQPVLVGTISIENSEKLSSLLKKENIPHQVLNAKFHEQEAQIIAEAGRPGHVTIATNMAGRGTDIVLGGNLSEELKSLPENASAQEIEKIKAAWQERNQAVIAAGGLYVIGSERHESRRIDNQLRGRSARQGDPGQTRFYLSLQDDLMRIFASDRVSYLMQRLGMKEGESVEHPWVTKAIENAQKKVEGRNFDIRKELLEFDNVANDQRRVIYAQRFELLSSDDLSPAITAIRADVVSTLLDSFIPPNSLEEQWDIAGLESRLQQEFNLPIDIQKWLKEDESLHEEILRKRVLDEFVHTYEAKEAIMGAVVLRQIEKSIMLQSLDTHWREHLALMDYLRQGIHLRGYAAKNPKQEYKREAFELFATMLDSLKFNIISSLSKLEIQGDVDLPQIEAMRVQEAIHSLNFQHEEVPPLFAALQAELPSELATEDLVQSEKPVPFVREFAKVGRNEPCPCGSSKKYKQCHGQLM